MPAPQAAREVAGRETRRDVLVLFGILLLLVGLTSPYPYPPTTRGIHYVPFYIFFACAFFAWLDAWARRLAEPLLRGRKRAWLASPWLLPALAGAGVAWLNVAAMRRPFGLSPTQMLVQEMARRSHARFLVAPSGRYNLESLVTLARGYGLGAAVEVLPPKRSAAATADACSRADWVVASLPSPCGDSVQFFYGDDLVFAQVPERARKKPAAPATK